MVLTRPSRRAGQRSARIVAVAARWIQDGRRLDMQGLAEELGVSRVTLFRRVGSREALLGKVLAARRLLPRGHVRGVEHELRVART